MHQSPYLNASFQSRKAYKVNYYIQSGHYTYLARLMELCPLDGAKGILALLVELNNNHASKSVSLNASFQSRKAYKVNY